MDSLPSEIFLQILEPFGTRVLLPLALVSRRFYGLVSRLHYARLVEATALRDRKLILECYHPSAKISTPYMFCDYLGTDGLEQVEQDPTLEGMTGLYSRYRPMVDDEHRRPRARYATKAVLEGSEPPICENPSHDLYLKSAELFSELCTVVNMIKVEPKSGRFLSSVNILESVIRIWREWLAEESSHTVKTQELPPTTTPGSSILWTDSSRNFGLRLRVIEKLDVNSPILVGPGEDPPVSYTLEYEELLVRTNQLVLEMENSEAQQVNNSSNAVVIASYVAP